LLGRMKSSQSWLVTQIIDLLNTPVNVLERFFGLVSRPT
jgi:hypothetical protein